MMKCWLRVLKASKQKIKKGLVSKSVNSNMKGMFSFAASFGVWSWHGHAFLNKIYEW